ncbi:hypothetical protein [Demequina aurantiaca]|uniref:hypothetical protein n=1 Tax=Demequina aurantiaca TaxID=676200 RepID=UPI003D338B86
MSTRNMILMWSIVAGLALTTFFVGMVTGYRADEASVAADGETVFNLDQWRAALWTLVAATIVAGVVALAVTVRRAAPVDVKRVLAPASLIVVGVAAATLILPLALLSVAGVVWLIAGLARAPQSVPVVA